MSSPEAAQAFIEKIRQETTLNDRLEGSRIASFVRQSLKLISEQLYNKSTHFLLELLQNADDNQYQSATPTLCITYQPGSLRVDCNEVGFDDRNVEAICTIGESTKAGLDYFTGEKGIGFKSVFKVADAVWITSQNYSFKLDTCEDGELGMIAPQWDSFPEPRRPGFTSFYLRILDRCDEQEIIEEITSFQPTLLMFLRRLKQVELKVTRKDGTIWSEVVQRDAQRNNSIVSLSYKGVDRTYITRTRAITGLPTEPRRSHCSHTELVLAFPTWSAHERPPREMQKVYAFLPIREFGFEFMVQADFLLTANREDIDLSSKWNIAIRDEIPMAFLDAIHYFNSSPLRYHWPHYLPFGEISPFFYPTKTRILEELSKTPILEAFSETLEKPTALTFIPRELRDCDGIPFSLCESSANRYLSPRYPDWEIDSLVALGVQKLSLTSFLQDLELLGGSFLTKPTTWHSQLARALLPFMVDDNCRSAIRGFSLIPLRSGKWVSPQGRSIYFPGGTRGLNIPSGVELLVVDPEALNDSWRKDLFEQLGVKDCDTLEVCRAIICGPCGGFSIPRWLKRKQFVAQTTYLYESSWVTLESIPFWFMTADQKHYQGSKAYIRGFSAYVRKPVDEESPQKRVYDLLQSEFPFIHEDYSTGVQKADSKWHSWLEASFGVSTIPRLVQGLPSEASIGSFGLQYCGLSEEIKFLFANGDSSDILWFLRENWNAYTEWLEKALISSFYEQAISKLREEMGSLSVKCRSGQSASLRNTFIASLDYETESHPNLHILDIEDSQNPSWSFLEFFGVTIRVDVNYYLRCLELLENTEPDEDLIVHIYEKVQDFYGGNEELVASRFREQSLFYLPKDPSKHRVSSRWLSAKRAIYSLADFETEYPTCTMLFRCLLIAGDGEFEPLVAQATFISGSTRLCDISQICRDLNAGVQRLSPRKAQVAVRRLITHPMFPVIRSRRVHGFDDLAQVSENKIYIADRLYLANSFRGIVPLLAFTSEELSQVKDLLSVMKVKWPLLSKIVASEVRPQGRISVHHGYTAYLRARVCFLQMLVPSSHPNRQGLCAQIANVEAALASKIIKTHNLKIGENEICGRPSQATVASSVATDKLQVFFTDKCITMKIPNLELIESISHHFQIKEHSHVLLLSLTLSGTDLEQLRVAFVQHDLHVLLPQSIQTLSSKRKEPRRYAGNSMELHAVSSPFTQFDERPGGPIETEYDESLDGIFLYQNDVSIEGNLHRRKRRKCEPEVTREMPFLDVIQTDRIFEVGTYLSDDKLQYIGEIIANDFFVKHLRSLYAPAVHWTSCKRASCRGPEGVEEVAAFHLTRETSEAMSLLLAAQGCQRAATWHSAKPEYHFETAITTGYRTESFPFSAPQLDRIRRYRLPSCPDCLPEHVSILMRISNVYTGPVIDLYLDPWQLLTSDHLSFTGNAQLKAVLKDTSFSIFNDSEIDIFPCHDYHYRPVFGKEIRLLNLLPSDKTEDPLRAVVTHASLDNAGDFRALSYVWGHGSRSCVLETQGGRLNITPSLLSALKHLRRQHDPITLWVDAVCINQEDRTEKASQIKLLPHIFQHALSTLAFLSDDGMNDHAVETLMQVKAKASQDKVGCDFEGPFGSVESFDQGGMFANELQSTSSGDDEDLWPDCLPRVPRSWADKPIPPPEDQIWEDIKRFFEHPWFRRIWVVQEVVLASAVRVLSGKWVINWNDLLSAVEIIDREWCTSSHYATIQKPWEHFLEIATYREREARKNRMALINLLESFRHAESTLARDRIFALLGFAADSKNRAFEPDYSSPFEEIVCRVAKAFIQQGRIMLLLYRAELDPDSRDSTARFPSWIPNWTKPKKHCLWESSHRGVEFAASWKAEPWVDDDPNFDTIKEIALHGVVIDTIVTVSEASCTRDQLSVYLREVDVMVEGNLLEAYASKSINREDLKWQVPVAGARYPRTTPDMETDLRSSYKALREVLGLNNFSSSGLSSASAFPPTVDFETRAASENYKRALFECVEGWRFFVTARGYVGVGPAAIQANDVVSIFDGSAVPFVTRSHDIRHGEWMSKFVGECYVHGLMNGEGEHLDHLKEGWLKLC